MKKIDLHGVRMEMLDKVLDTLILDALTMDNKEIELITGTGILQKSIIDKCKILYGYEAHISLNNKGVVIISLET